MKLSDFTYVILSFDKDGNARQLLLSNEEIIEALILYYYGLNPDKTLQIHEEIIEGITLNKKD